MSYFHGVWEDAVAWYGACKTEDEAIALGRQVYDSNFWIGTGRLADICQNAFEPDNVLERCEDDNEDLMWMEESLADRWSPTLEQLDYLQTCLNRAFYQWMEDQGFDHPEVVTALREIQHPVPV